MMAEIELLQKTQKKQAEFEAEEMTKKNTERLEELRQKVKVKAEEQALLKRFETLKTRDNQQGSTLDFRSEMTKALTKAFQSECESPFDL